MSERIPTTDDVIDAYAGALGVMEKVILSLPHAAEMLFDSLWDDPATVPLAELLIDFFARAEVRRKARVGCPAEDPEEVAAEIARQEYGG